MTSSNDFARRVRSDEQIRRLLALLDLPWGDLHPAIEFVAYTLSYLMKLTPEEFLVWEADPEADYDSEFDAPVDEARARPPDWRLAHIARLIRSLAMVYGIETDYRRPLSESPVPPNPHSPAGVLAELAAIQQLSRWSAN